MNLIRFLILPLILIGCSSEKGVSLEKIKVNAKKYPVNKVRGRCIKYSDL